MCSRVNMLAPICDLASMWLWVLRSPTVVCFPQRRATSSWKLPSLPGLSLAQVRGEGSQTHLSMESNVKELADTPSNHSDCMLLRSECVADLLLAMRCWAVLFSENRPPPPNTLCVLEGSFSQEGFFRKGMRAQPPFQGWHMTP